VNAANILVVVVYRTTTLYYTYQAFREYNFTAQNDTPDNKKGIYSIDPKKLDLSALAYIWSTLPCQSSFRIHIYLNKSQSTNREVCRDIYLYQLLTHRTSNLHPNVEIDTRWMNRFCIREEHLLGVFAVAVLLGTCCVIYK
jgi:hypothetical protein